MTTTPPPVLPCVVCRLHKRYQRLASTTKVQLLTERSTGDKNV
jgi:hypothetical protein